MKVIKLLICLIMTMLIAGCVEDDSESIQREIVKPTDVDVKNLVELDFAMKQGKYDYVIEHAVEYVTKYPKSDVGWLLLGWAYKKNGNFDEAQNCFQESLSINKTNDNAYVGMGSVCLALGDSNGARENYEHAINLCPDSPQAYSSLLVVELADGRYDQAVELGEKAWSLSKGIASVPANLCIAYHYNGDFAKRDYYYNKAIRMKYHDMDSLDELIAGNTPADQKIIEPNIVNYLDLPVEQREYVCFPTVGVKIRKPVDFEKATRFHGFGQAATNSSVMAMLISCPFSEIIDAFDDKDKIKAQGMTLISSQAMQVDGKTAILHKLKQAAYDSVFSKWCLFVGDKEKTVMVNAVYPFDDQEYGTMLKSTLLGIKFYDPEDVDLAQEIGFEIASSEKLKIMLGISMANTVMYSKNGKDVKGYPEHPVLIVGQSYSISYVEDKLKFAMARITQFPDVEIEKLNSLNPVTIDNLDGYEIIADAIKKETNTSIKVYMVILYEESAYCLATGMVGVQLADEFIPEFERLTFSFKRTR